MVEVEEEEEKEGNNFCYKKSNTVEPLIATPPSSGNL